MLSLRKKPADKAAASLAPAWHPDFRNFQRLPDTKAVRTTFFINGVSISIAAALALYVAYKEYTLQGLRSDTANWRQQIETARPASDQAVALFKKFQAEEKKVLELRDFREGSFVASDFLLQLGETITGRVVITSVDYRSAGVTLRAGVTGLPDQASDDASAYVEQLRTDPNLGPRFESVALTGVNRNPAGQLDIELYLKFKPAKPAPKK